MKWVKVAIGAVIAILSISIIATSVYSMTQGVVKDEVVTFEVLTETTVTVGTYSLIDRLALVDDDIYNTVINLKSITLDNVILDDFEITHSTLLFNIYGDGIGTYDFILENDDTIISEGYDITEGDVWEIIFEVTTPAQLTGITATLILLTPLIFAGGVLAYLLNKQEL